MDNWTSPRYKSRSPSGERNQDHSGYGRFNKSTGFHPHKEFLTRERLEHDSMPREVAHDEFNANKFKYNTPRVNEIISEVRHYQKMRAASTRSEDTSSHKYFLSPNAQLPIRDLYSTERDWAKYGNVAELDSKYGQKYPSSSLIETPEKGLERIDYGSAGYRSLYAREGAQLSPLRVKCDQTTEEIVRELRAKYGSQKKAREAQKEQEQRQENEVNNKEVKEVEEKKTCEIKTEEQQENLAGSNPTTQVETS